MASDVKEGNSAEDPLPTGCRLRKGALFRLLILVARVVHNPGSDSLILLPFEPVCIIAHI